MKIDNGNGTRYITFEKFLKQVQRKTEGKELRFKFSLMGFEIFQWFVDVYYADPESRCAYLLDTFELTIKDANRLAKKMIIN